MTNFHVHRNRNLQLSPIIDSYIFDGISKDAESLLLEYLIAPGRALEQLHHDISYHKRLLAFLNENTLRRQIPTGLLLFQTFAVYLD